MKTIFKPENQHTKELILQLIKADLIHHQLLNGLSSIHLQSNSYESELYKPIARLMGIEGEIGEEWLTVYGRYMDGGRLKQALDNPGIHETAAKCYTELSLHC